MSASARPVPRLDPEYARAMQARALLAAPGPEQLRVLRILAVTLSVAAMGLAVVVLTGWLSGQLILTRLHPAFNSMKVVGAMALLSLAMSVAWLNVRSPSEGEAQPPSRWVDGLASVAVVVATLVMAERLLGLPVSWFRSGFGVQSWHQPLEADPLPPLIAIVMIGILGVAAIALNHQRPVLGQALVVGCTFLALMACMGFLFGVRTTLLLGVFTAVSLPAALGILALSLALLAARAEFGLMLVITGESAGGRMARWLIPLVVFLPIAAGEVAIATNQGHLDSHFLVATFSSAFVILGVVGSWYVAWRMRHVDLQRVAYEDLVHTTRLALAERDEMAASLARANADLSSFAAVAAHDLRAPLVAIRGYAELLADHPRMVDDARGQDWIDRIINGSDRGAQLIVDVLDCARLATREIQPEPIELKELLTEIVDHSAHPDRVRLDPMLPVVLGEEPLLRQLFGNLIENAFKYAPADREVTVWVLADPVMRVAGQAMASIRVCDDGVGIPRDEHVHVLGMFVRGTETEVAGTGLGLAICARVAERHGGKLWIEDTPGGGTTVVVTLPVADGPGLPYVRRDGVT